MKGDRADLPRGHEVHEVRPAYRQNPSEARSVNTKRSKPALADVGDVGNPNAPIAFSNLAFHEGEVRSWGSVFPDERARGTPVARSCNKALHEKTQWI